MDARQATRSVFSIKQELGREYESFFNMVSTIRLLLRYRDMLETIKKGQMARTKI